MLYRKIRLSIGLICALNFVGSVLASPFNMILPGERSMRQADWKDAKFKISPMFAFGMNTNGYDDDNKKVHALRIWDEKQDALAML